MVAMREARRRTVRWLVMNKHPQRNVFSIVVPAGFDDPYRLILDVPKNWYVYFPEIAEALYAVGSAESQKV